MKSLLKLDPLPIMMAMMMKMMMMMVDGMIMTMWLFHAAAGT